MLNIFEFRPPNPKPTPENQTRQLNNAAKFFFNHYNLLKLSKLVDLFGKMLNAKRYANSVFPLVPLATEPASDPQDSQNVHISNAEIKLRTSLFNRMTLVVLSLFHREELRAATAGNFHNNYAIIVISYFMIIALLSKPVQCCYQRQKDTISTLTRARKRSFRLEKS